MNGGIQYGLKGKITFSGIFLILSVTVGFYVLLGMYRPGCFDDYCMLCKTDFVSDAHVSERTSTPIDSWIDCFRSVYNYRFCNWGNGRFADAYARMALFCGEYIYRALNAVAMFAFLFCGSLLCFRKVGAYAVLLMMVLLFVITPDPASALFLPVVQTNYFWGGSLLLAFLLLYRRIGTTDSHGSGWWSGGGDMLYCNRVSFRRTP